MAAGEVREGRGRKEEAEVILLKFERQVENNYKTNFGENMFPQQEHLVVYS